MERGGSEYSQPEQQPPAPYPPAPEVRPANFSSSGTPTSEYGMNPPSSRSSTFPEYISRQPYAEGARYPPPPNQSGGGADPAIAATSPTYPPPGSYSPYPAQGEMSPPYQGHQGHQGAYPRSEWSGYPAHPHGLPAYSAHGSPSASIASGSPATSSSQRPQVYSFVPIPGAQQHKRPRRRYEEIDRMYKCGWNGCEKAYGTLNHLNAHVTMQSHGAKRTPEEFKEIRKEWKARRKEEQNQRKSEEERQRSAAVGGQGGPVEGPPGPADPSQASSPTTYGPGVRPQLPPIGYAPGQGAPVQGGYPPTNGIEPVTSYGNNAVYANYPSSPYGQGGQVYSQHPDGPPSNYQQ